PFGQRAGNVLGQEGRLPLPGHLALVIDVLFAKQLDQLVRDGGGQRHQYEIQRPDVAGRRDSPADGPQVEGQFEAAQRVKLRRVLFQFLVNGSGRSVDFVRLAELEGTEALLQPRFGLVGETGVEAFLDVLPQWVRRTAANGFLAQQ